MIGIYKIENTVNGKVYIGQSVNIEHRWYEHKLYLNKKQHHNVCLQAAWNKYGEICFNFNIVEECSINELNEKEIYWIDYYNSYIDYNGYNLTYGGESGITLSPDVINKIYILYDSGLTAAMISKELNIYVKTVCKYLKNGNDKGLCEYNPKKDGPRNHMKKIICLTTNEIFNSITSAENKYNIVGIYECLNHNVKYTGKDNDGNLLIWMYYDEYINMSKEEIESYIKDIKIQSDYRIICLNTGKIYRDYKEANIFAGLSGKQSIANCCNGKKQYSGKTKTGEKLQWMYCKDYIKKYGEVV